MATDGTVGTGGDGEVGVAGGPRHWLHTRPTTATGRRPTLGISALTSTVTYCFRGHSEGGYGRGKEREDKQDGAGHSKLLPNPTAFFFLFFQGKF